MRSAALDQIAGETVECKTVELELNYERDMVRYRFQPLHKQGESPDVFAARVRAYTNTWANLFLAEKKKQLTV